MIAATGKRYKTTSSVLHVGARPLLPNYNTAISPSAPIVKRQIHQRDSIYTKRIRFRKKYHGVKSKSKLDTHEVL